MLASVTFSGESKNYLIRGVTHVSETQRTIDTIEDAPQCKECGSTACHHQGVVRISRRRDDKGCESVFEKWFQSKKHGSISVEVEPDCGKRSAICFEGYACKLERHDLKQCDDRLPSETLSIRLAHVPVCAPVVFPTTLVGKFERGVLYFDFTVHGGCLNNARLKLRNLLPFASLSIKNSSVLIRWLLVAGPAPGTNQFTYTSPKPLKVRAYFDYNVQNAAAFPAKEIVRSIYDYLQNEVKLVLVFETGSVESGNVCETQTACFDLCLPPTNTISPYCRPWNSAMAQFQSYMEQWLPIIRQVQTNLESTNCPNIEKNVAILKGDIDGAEAKYNALISFCPCYNEEYTKDICYSDYVVVGEDAPIDLDICDCLGEEFEYYNQLLAAPTFSFCDEDVRIITRGDLENVENILSEICATLESC